MPTLVHALQATASDDPNAVAYRYLLDGVRVSQELTYGQLERRARAVAAAIQASTPPGARVLLLFPDGLELLVGFHATLFAGAVAVPAYPPVPERLDSTLGRLMGIVGNCSPTVALTTRAGLEIARPLREEIAPLGAMTWIAIDDIDDGDAGAWRMPALDGSMPAFLQYTSGSTGEPKGVVLRHANLMHNIGLLSHELPMERGAAVASWMPLYHDMGLIGFCLWPITFGGNAAIMPPTAFLRSPIVWLRAISRYGAAFAGGPNFSFDLAVRRTAPDEREGLDLRCVRYMVNGAEPVRRETLELFTSTFRDAGFDASMFYPCYGLAEATVFVSGGRSEQRWVARDVDADALEQRGVIEVPAPHARTRPFVGVGRPAGDQRVLIVDPETRTRCPPGVVGEVWIQGKSIGAGYWNQLEETEATFRAQIADAPHEGAFLRTGDLGFIGDEQLFITGRCKDLIIVRGTNHYPQDIERTVESAAAGLRRGCGAVFTVEVAAPLGGVETRLVVVQEVDRRAVDSVAADGAERAPPPGGVERRRRAEPLGGPERRAPFDPELVFRRIRAHVADGHDLLVHAIVLVAPGTIPKTTSGKIRRRETRAAFETGRLSEVAGWRASSEAELSESATPSISPVAAVRTPAEIEAWLVRWIAARTGVSPSSLDVDRPPAEHGLDSLLISELSEDLQRWLGRPVEESLFWDEPSLAAAARFLAGGVVPSPARVEAVSTDAPIAVVGLACRFPGAPDPAAFWQLLRSGSDAVTEIPRERWDPTLHYDADPSAPGKSMSRWGGFIAGHELFDPTYFGIAPREAGAMDPHQRLMLEVATEALYDGGITPSRLAGTATGVFVGLSLSEHAHLAALHPEQANMYTATGNFAALAANRLSYAFDLRGPSMSVDAVCSSSLLAVHLACESLRRGECTVALAGGAVLLLSPQGQLWFSKLGVLSPTGRCRAFDAKADGIVLGEGVGAVVLEPLDRARGEGHPVYGVIRGSAVVQDGRSNGMTAPSQSAQEDMLYRAYARAGVDPATVQFVEAHGTGTRVGDPIEARALGAVLGRDRAKDAPCLIGSVKTNIGHLSMAGGVASLIKVLLSLRHGWVPPSLHFEDGNAAIAFEALGLRVATELTPLRRGPEPAVAGVTSLSFGGTNVHLVVSDAPALEAESDGEALVRPSSAPPPAAPADSTPPRLVPLSAHGSEPLLAVVDQVLGLLTRAPLPTVEDLVHTFAMCRPEHDYRYPVVVRSIEELQTKLAEATPRVTRRPARTPRLVLVMSGFGAQWAGMGADLARGYPVFGNAIEACEEAIVRQAGWSLKQELARPAHETRLHRADIGQPASFAIQIALERLFRSWGIVADEVIGHSAGEVAAAHVAGVLPLEQAVRVILSRGAIQQRIAGKGGLVASEIDRPTAERVARTSGVQIAAFNGPSFVTFTGSTEALDGLCVRLEDEGASARRLAVGFAAHSAMLDPHLDDFARLLERLAPTDGSIPLISTVTGDYARGSELGPEYWVRNLRAPVELVRGVQSLGVEQPTTFLEISPDPRLLGAVTQSFAGATAESVAIPTLREGGGGAELLDALGQLWAHGQAVAWPAVQSGGAFVRLPPYPWRHDRFPLPDVATAPTPPSERSSGMVDRTLESSISSGDQFAEGDVSLKRYPELEDHRIDGYTVVPAAFYMAFAVDGLARMGQPSATLRALEFSAGLVLGPDDVRVMQLAARSEPEPTLRVSTIPAEGYKRRWTTHVTATVGGPLPGGSRGPTPQERLEGAEEISVEEFYAAVAASRGWYGRRFRCLSKCWRGPGYAVGLIPAVEASSAGASVDVVRLDGCLQTLLAAVTLDVARVLYLPSHIGELDVQRVDGESPWWVVAEVTSAEEGEIRGHIAVVDDTDRPVVSLRDVRLRRVSAQESVAPAFARVDWRGVSSYAASRHLRDVGGAWIVFCDDSGRTARILRHWGARARRLVEVRRSDRFERVGPRSYRIDPSSPDDYRRLLAEIRTRQGDRPSGVIHGWALDEHGDIDGSDELERTVIMGPGSVGHLVAALTREGLTVQPRLWLITSGGQQVQPNDRSIEPRQAAMWGTGRVLANEHPPFECSLVDVDADAHQLTEEAVARLVLSDEPGREHAYRAGAHYVPRLVPYEVGGLDASPLVRSDATYLVTGGLGGLGLLVARALAERGARRLLLLGRTPPDEGQRAALAEIEALGSEVTPVECDVSDRDALRAVLDAVSPSFPLRGIVHSAGTVADGPLVTLNTERFVRPMRAKVLGAFHLHALTKSQPLDHFVIFSSVSGVLGFPAQANYAAANAVCDALAAHRRALGMPAVSVQWGPWAKVGGAVRLGVLERLEAQGLRPIEPSQGVEAFFRLLGSPVPQVAFVPADWARYAQGQDGFGRSELVAAHQHTREAQERLDLDRGRLRLASAAQRRELLRTFLRQEVGSILHSSIDPVDEDVALTTLGLDSLTAVELCRRLERALSEPVALTRVLRGASVNELADELSTRITHQHAEVRGGHERQVLMDARLDADLKPAQNASPPLDPPEAVLLTGATGFLGSFLLSELLAATDSVVWCLVRGRSDEEARARLVSTVAARGCWPREHTDRVRVIAGDLGKERFGLDTELYQLLADSVDAIYHAGAIVNFLYPYEAVRNTNVGGTKEAIRLAVTGRAKRLHHVSTAYTFFFPDDPRRRVNERDGIDACHGFLTGYQKSKWVAEKLVGTAASRGVATAIYRPSWIEGDTGTGVSNPQDFLSNLLRACVEIGAAPDLDLVADIVPVDYVSKALVRLSLSAPTPGECFHLVNPQPVTWTKLLDLLGQAGLSLPRVPFETWKRRLDDRSEREREEVLPLVGEMFADDVRARRFLACAPVLDCRATLERVASDAIVCPAIDVELARTYVTAFRQAGFIR